jgi:hypothetical protein
MPQPKYAVVPLVRRDRKRDGAVAVAWAHVMTPSLSSGGAVNLGPTRLRSRRLASIRHPERTEWNDIDRYQTI